MAADHVGPASQLDWRKAREGLGEETARREAAAEMHQRSRSGTDASGSGVETTRGTGKGGLIPGVFYLGDTAGGVPSGRILDVGDLNGAFRDGGRCEAGSPKRAASNASVSGREQQAQRRLFEGDASVLETLTGRAESSEVREPRGSRSSFGLGAQGCDTACSDEGTNRSRDGVQGTGGSTGVADRMAPGQAAPLGILGFLQGLFSPVGAGKTGRGSEEVNGGREREGEEALLGVHSNRGMENGGQGTSVSSRGVEGKCSRLVL